MKKILHIMLILLATTLSTVVANAQQSTLNHLAVTDVTLNPGDPETQYVSLKLVGTTRYAAYNVDITIPEGVELAYDEGDPDVYFDQQTTIIPFKKGLPLYQLSATYTESDRNLRLSCFSATSGTEFKNDEGILCYIGLKASAYTKPGKLSMALTGQNLTTKDAEKDVPEDASYENITIGTTGYVDLTVSGANNWSTCILPFASALPEGVKAYTCNSRNEDEKVFYLDEAESIEAYTPYVLYSEAGYDGQLTGEIDAAGYPESGVVTAGYLKGAVKKQNISEGYVLQKLNGEVKFYKADPSKTYKIPSGKCWAMPTGGSADGYGFELMPTAVKALKATMKNTDGSIYSIDGKKMTAPQAGQLFIKDGKKMTK